MISRTTVTSDRLLRLAHRGVGRLFRLLFRFRVYGVERVPTSGPVLLAGNHTGFLDGPLIYLALGRPASFLAKAELYRVRPLAALLDWAAQIPVRRGQPDRTALRRCLEVLAAGGIVGVFPEGSRGAGEFESVQHGVGYLAVKSAAPVVPVVCLGSSDALPNGRLLPRLGTRIDVVFGEPFRVDPQGDPRARSTVAVAAEEVRRRLHEHLLSSLRATGRDS
jgi:1-acyl-sn-glycerol-3-phosphate acyltransferase